MFQKLQNEVMTQVPWTLFGLDFCTDHFYIQIILKPVIALVPFAYYFVKKLGNIFFFCVSCFYKLAVFFKRPNVLVSESIKKKEYNKNIFSIAFTTLKLKPAETKDTAKNGIQQELAERM